MNWILGSKNDKLVYWKPNPSGVQNNKGFHTFTDQEPGLRGSLRGRGVAEMDCALNPVIHTLYWKTSAGIRQYMSEQDPCF